MRFTGIKLKNWRNFTDVDVKLTPRVFIAGANASGKSNFLDAFRFLKDLAENGLEKAMEARGGVKKVRSLYARRSSDIQIEVVVSDKNTIWKYAIGIKQEQRGKHKPIISKEVVIKNDKELINRPDNKDKKDPRQKTQTALEQIYRNTDFIELADFFKKISYLHIVPQIIRHPELFPWQKKGNDYFGWTLIEKIASTPDSIQSTRLGKIEEALRNIVPHFTKLALTKPDISGKRHLEILFEHWRGHGAKQNELEFSDGTLRIIGLFWALLDGKEPLLMEEPELYLHSSVVKKIPSLIHRLQKKAGNRQVFISTHSSDLFSRDTGVAPKEILLLIPSNEATNIIPLTVVEGAKVMIANGLDFDEIVEQNTKPPKVKQLDLFINKI